MTFILRIMYTTKIKTKQKKNVFVLKIFLVNKQLGIRISFLNFCLPR